MAAKKARTVTERKKMKHSRIKPCSLMAGSPLGAMVQERERIMAAGPAIEEDVKGVIGLIGVAAKSCNHQDMFTAAEAFGAINGRVIGFQETLDSDSPQWAHIDRLRGQMASEYKAAKDQMFYCGQLCFTD
jgi:hypothetical protein